ncbi:hypothetical protein E2P64_01560 [Candidatus Bathyarchaeota archaeon]|nr:hypothetical protein E2P64_01560 [Candidatus Bathyarchaeota archaeon]
MSKVPRRIIFKWTSTSSIFSILLLTASTIMIQLFLIQYLVTRGLEFKFFIIYGLAIPYLYIPLIGFVAVILSCWMYLTEKKATIHAKPGTGIPIMILPVRMFEAAFILLAMLTGLLFLPYVLGSNWILGFLFSIQSSIPALKTAITGFYGYFSSIMGFAPIMKYFFSNFISFLIIGCTVIIIGRKSRRRIKRR